jgi:hypothetical protein
MAEFFRHRFEEAPLPTLEMMMSDDELRALHQDGWLS